MRAVILGLKAIVLAIVNVVWLVVMFALALAMLYVCHLANGETVNIPFLGVIAALMSILILYVPFDWTNKKLIEWMEE